MTRAKHTSAPAKRARRTLLRYLDIALPNGAHAEHATAICRIVDDIIDAAVLAVREDERGDPAGVGGSPAE